MKLLSKKSREVTATLELNQRELDLITAAVASSSTHSLLSTVGVETDYTELRNLLTVLEEVRDA
jgi:hypothetical protein